MEKSLENDFFCELSINWVDDEGAVATLLDQVNTRKNCPQFQGGHCRFPRIVLIAAMRDYITNEHLSSDRRPIEVDLENGVAENRYHGNILMKNNLSKQAKGYLLRRKSEVIYLTMRKEPEFWSTFRKKSSGDSI